VNGENHILGITKAERLIHGVQIVFLFIYAVYALFLGFRHRPIVVVSRLYS
jgi:hypothetical protein